MLFWKKYISIGCILFINLLFTYKYASRYIDFPLITAISLILIQLLIVRFGSTIKINRFSSRLINFGAIFLVLSIAVIAYFKFPLPELNVDRWSVIDSFLVTLFKGDYPYFATSHLGNPPGPMPFYYILALPFWWLDQLSLFSALGYILLIYILHSKKNISIYWITLVLITSAFLFWEVVVRSNIVTNTVLVVLLLDGYNKRSNLKRNSIWIGIGLGLLLATRSVFVLPYIVFFLSKLLCKQHDFKSYAITLISAMLAFGITFLPFIIAFPQDFLIMNPFIVQGSFLVPSYYIIGFVGIAVLAAFISKPNFDRFFWSGIVLFLSILAYAINLINTYGFYEALITKSFIDISYFLFCIPFFIWYIILHKRSQI